MPAKRGQGRDARVWTVIGVNFLILTVLVICALIYSHPMFDTRAEHFIAPISILLLAIAIWSVWSWRMLTGSLFDPYVLFLIAAILFNGGQAFLELFQLNQGGSLKDNLSVTQGGILESQYPPKTILETLFLVTLGLTAFHTGGLFSALLSNVGLQVKEIKTNKANALSKAKALRLVGWGLLAISFIPTFLLLNQRFAVVLSSGYGALYQQDVATGINAGPATLASFIIPASLFLLAGSKGYRLNIAISLATLLPYALIMFFLGYRAWAVMPLIAYAWVYHRCIRPIPGMVLLGAGGILLVVLFPLISAVRNISGEKRLSLDVLWQAYLSIDNPAISIISEMGGSMRTVADTLSLVPNIRDFDMGESYFYGALTVIPNLFWEVHPSIVHGSLSDWLTKTVAPETARSGGGLGFSFIAEAYLNFGWLGAPLALIIMGFLLAKLVFWAGKPGDPAKIATVASFTSFVLLYARGDSTLIFRPFVWYALIPYLGVHTLTLLMGPKLHMMSGRFRASRAYSATYFLGRK